MSEFTKLETLLLASHNKGKCKEFEKLLAPYAKKIVSAADKKLEEPEETEKTFSGNAKLKAQTAAKATGLLTLADDSGFGLAALDGKPGVLSARFAKTKTGFDYPAAAEKLMGKLNEDDSRSAFFTCVLALARPTGSAYIVEGRCEGRFIHPGRGENGHGYDPFFIPEGSRKTFAEMSEEEKNQISHRAKALTKLVKFLDSDDGRMFTGVKPKAE